jgi:hypothetical protein
MFAGAPVLRYQFEGTKRYVTWLGPNLQLNVIDDEGWRFGPMLSYRGERDRDVDNDVVKQMKKIDPSLPKGKEETRREDEQIPEEPDGSSGQ